MNYQNFCGECICCVSICCHFYSHILSLSQKNSWLVAKIDKIHELESNSSNSSSSSIPTSIYCIVCISHMITSIVLKMNLWAMNELITIVNSYWRPKEFKWESRWNEMYGEEGWVGGWMGVLCVFYMCIVQLNVLKEEKEKNWIKERTKVHKCTYQMYNRLSVLLILCDLPWKHWNALFHTYTLTQFYYSRYIRWYT